VHFVLYRSDHCPACRKLSADLRHRCRRTDATLEERDILDHLEEAARLGITRPPAVVLDGRLLGQGPAALRGLRGKLR